MSSRCGPTVLAPRRTSSLRLSLKQRASPFARHSGLYNMPIGVWSSGSSASSTYAACTWGKSNSSICARTSPSCVPCTANLSSHTSSVVATSGESRPPDCLSNALRCLSTRSTSLHNASCFGHNATSASSKKSLRTDGASCTRLRSWGENTVVRTTPNKSRVLANFCLFTSTLLRPVRLSSASISTSRPSEWVMVARITAVLASVRIIASVGTPLKLLRVAKYDNASTRFVLPCPLSPMTAVTPSVNVICADT